MTIHKKVGVVSIRRKIDPYSMSFEDSYKGIGLNTGNMMFTAAIYDQIDAELVQVDYDFDPSYVNSTFDALVIPAANWLGIHSDWDWLVSQIEEVEIPVVTVGIGAQAPNSRLDTVDWNDSSVRLARVLASKAPYLSTRGHYTTSCLQRLGILNVITTGCPSIYRQFPRVVGQPATGNLVIQSTRYGITKSFAEKPSVNQSLFRFAFEHKLDMVYQSEPEEMNYLIEGEAAEIFTRKPYHLSALQDLYGAETSISLKSYLDQHGKVFYDLEQWSQYIQSANGVLGTRLHGAIIALNSGVPAVLIPHDSRTSELITFAKIPSAELRSFDWMEREMAQIPEILDQIGYYEETRKFNHDVYRQFLTANGLGERSSSIVQ
ncbi:polysaccharide pyruvyl transferase family protein [Rhizobium mayense]|uniref:polysaccharide pyruvyl transferase family protein n=1 Tax=Rhizobium mayense TaxID=1312184 RepID=UPI00398C590D